MEIGIFGTKLQSKSAPIGAAEYLKALGLLAP
jgi:hypothetical protein